MQEIKGNLFDYSTYFKPDAICITTNGCVKNSNGTAVMGRGCALEAATRFNGLDKILGAKLRQLGNQVHYLLTEDNVAVVSFPVKGVEAYFHSTESLEQHVVKHMQKKFVPPCKIPGWALKADLDIIVSSAYQLVELANEKAWKSVVLPQPGCGAGELNWKTVKSGLQPILNERFYAITY